MKNVICYLFFVTAICYSCKTDIQTETTLTTNSEEKVLRSEIDTFYLGNRLIHVSSISKKDFLELTPNMVVDTLEAKNIINDSTYVKRVNDTLLIRTKAKNVTLISNESDDENIEKYVVYEYGGYSRETNNFVINCYYYEGFGVALIDNNNGKITYVWSIPVTSPNNKFFATANSDLEAGYTYNGIQLFNNVHVPVLVAQRELKEWGPEEIRWKDDRTMFVKANRFDSLAENGQRTDYLKLHMQ